LVKLVVWVGPLVGSPPKAALNLEIMRIRFRSVKEMVNWLIDNESKELADHYGRIWKYERYKFYYHDISDDGHEFSEGIKALHLFGTIMYES